MAKATEDRERSIATNRRARHEYFIEDTYEAGIAFTGSEIKSVRAGRISLQEGYAKVENGEVWLCGVHIAPYKQATIEQHDPLRKRKLLLHRGEISRLTGKLHEKGLTLVPLRVYIKGNHAKVELGLARGKKLYDKREDIAEREAKRQIERALKRHAEE